MKIIPRYNVYLTIYLVFAMYLFLFIMLLAGSDAIIKHAPWAAHEPSWGEPHFWEYKGFEIVGLMAITIPVLLVFDIKDDDEATQ